jgi:hypothetical protein
MHVLTPTPTFGVSGKTYAETRAGRSNVSADRMASDLGRFFIFRLFAQISVAKCHPRP